MSTAYKGVNYADTQASPITQIEGGQYNVPALHILDQFVLTADLAANDTILVGGLIPEGAILLDAKVVVPTALGGAAAINFGYQAGPAEPTGSPTPQAVSLSAFFASLVVSSAVVASALGSAQQGTFYTQAALTSQVQPIITCTVATSGATGLSIYVDISYTKAGG